MGSERGQGTVEWVGLVAARLAACWPWSPPGCGCPGATLARAVADRILCAAALADGCGDEPALIAAYGTEVGRLVRRHMPMLVFERGSRAVPVDFRRCRSSECGDAAGEGLIAPNRRRPAGHRLRPRGRLPRGGGGADRRPPAPTAPASAPATSTSSTGSTTPTRRPSAACRSRARRATTRTTGRASSSASAPTAASTSAPPPTTATTTSAATATGPPTPASLAHDGWGPETHLLLVSGGSHAGNAIGTRRQRPLHPRPPRPPRPARADRRRERRPLRRSRRPG